MTGKKGASGLLQCVRVSSAQGFAALFAGRVVPSSDSLLPEFQTPPNPEVPKAKTSVPPLPRHGPEVLAVGPQDFEVPRSILIPTKPKCKVKAKPKVKVELDFRVRPVSLRPANGSRSDGWKRPWQRPWQRPASDPSAAAASSANTRAGGTA